CGQREEEHAGPDRFFLGVSRRFDWAKPLRWKLQKKIELGSGETRIVSRNNAMRPPLAPLELLRYRSRHDTDIIQEYYVPVENFVPFMDRFREILVAGKLNVLSSTVRYVAPNATPALAYAPHKPAFAIIQMSNVELSADGQAHAQAGALLLAAGYCFGFEPPYRGTLVERPPRPLIFAHRGFGDHGPDNSLYAVQHALQAGMDGVDMDGQLTRDSELVIFHDLSVD